MDSPPLKERLAGSDVIKYKYKVMIRPPDLMLHRSIASFTAQDRAVEVFYTQRCRESRAITYVLPSTEEDQDTGLISFLYINLLMICLWLQNQVKINRPGNQFLSDIFFWVTRLNSVHVSAGQEAFHKPVGKRCLNSQTWAGSHRHVSHLTQRKVHSNKWMLSQSISLSWGMATAILTNCQIIAAILTTENVISRGCLCLKDGQAPYIICFNQF